MTAYYNEFDRSAAEWLRNLIDAGLIAPGHVDERSIEDVLPTELAGYTQCHFFAGIGGWSYALRLAGWPDDKPVWTASCPCQPFSQAGAGAGIADERHLWPAFKWLIEQQKRKPSVIFGEQVASKLGREWLSGVRIDLEGLGYAVGAADLCAAGVAAPHIRQRLFWVADANQSERGRLTNGEERECDRSQAERKQGHCQPEYDCSDLGLPDTESERRGEAWTYSGRSAQWSAWAGAEWIACADGKARRIEPGLSPLANGVSGRVVVVVPDKQTGATISHWYNRKAALKGFGNAIVPEVAAEFITSYCKVTT